MLPKKAVVFLTVLFNSCLRFGYFPKIWKHAQIILFKKPGKPKDSLSSYRPVSLLTTLSKLFEKIIASRLKKIIIDWNILPSFQFGFRDNHSSTQQLLRFSEFANRQFEDKKYVATAFLDFKQAFDKIWHEGLLFKLRKIGMPLYLLQIITSFLKDRTFATKIENQFSSVRSITSSVPQGSILGPILFIIYVYDIASNIDQSQDVLLAMFADDKLIAHANDDLFIAQSNLQKSVTSIEKWCQKWCLALNPVKSESKIFSLRRISYPSLPLTITNVVINWQINSVKWLGVWLDQRLNWASHLKNKINDGYQRLSMLFPVLNKRSSIGQKTALLIYKQIIIPLVTYACPVWITASKTNLNKLQVLQNKILRIITKAPWFVTNKNIHKDLDVEFIYQVLVKRTTEFINEHPHDLGYRIPYRRKKAHLPQDLLDVVNAAMLFD